MSAKDEETVEQYGFLRLYRIDVERARQLLLLAQRQESDELRFPLVELAIISYAKPFSKNCGTVVKRHSLDDAVVPEQHRQLHEELMALRDTLFAHTDYAAHNPQVSRWPGDERGPQYLFGFAVPGFPMLVARIPEFASLISVVEAAIVTKTESMHPLLDAIPARRARAPNEEL